MSDREGYSRWVRLGTRKKGNGRTCPIGKGYSRWVLLVRESVGGVPDAQTHLHPARPHLTAVNAPTPCPSVLVKDTSAP
eukprot:2922873-Rhodomonas_salina.1